MRPANHDPGYKNRFSDWLKSAKGSELMRYKAKNETEAKLIEAEINRRLDANIPPLAKKFAMFLYAIMEDE